jgi:hypothetical protein
MAHRPLVALLALFLVALSTPASAIEKCKARIDKKTGEILVSAGAVTGVPLWGGGSPDDPKNAFPELASCQKGTKLKSCRIGAAGSPAARRAPSSCTLSVSDDAGPCESYIQGCTASSMLGVFVSEVGMQGNWAISRGYGALSLTKGSTGEFEVEFDRAIDECFPSVTLFSAGHAEACVYCGATDRHLFVRTTDVAGASADLRFYATLLCP